VNPLRDVWSAANSLRQSSRSVIPGGRCRQAMLKVLPQLESGCINYWEAGNWALNFEAEPRGPKIAPVHRRSTCTCWAAAETPMVLHPMG